MNNKVLKKHKIDAKYVMSERKFMYTFGCLCLDEDFVLNKDWSRKERFCFFKDNLVPVPEEMVTFESVARGEVILVGRANYFHAFLRPEKKKTEIIKTVPKVHVQRVKKVETKEKTVGDYSLTELLNSYHENIDNELGQDYFEELIGRLHELECKEVQNRKNYVKVYKRKQHVLDKND